MRKKFKVLFALEQEYYWTSFAPLYKQMSQDPCFDLYIRIGKIQKRVAGIFLIGQTARIAKKFAGKKLTRRTQGFDAVICGDTLKNPEAYGEALLCNIEHAVSIKSQRYRKLAKQAGKVGYIRFVEGQYRRKLLSQYLPSGDIYTLGLPKLDQLFDGTYRRAHVLKKLGLSFEKKTVLYAPSYKPTSIFELTPELGKERDYNVIIKLHPYSWAGKYASHKQHRFVEKIVKKHPHLVLIPEKEVNIMPYLLAADTIITEGSSVMNEFLALGRCGIIYNTNVCHSDGQPVLQEKIENWLPGFVHLEKAACLGKALQAATEPSKKRLTQIEKDKAKIYDYCDAFSAQRVAQKIKQLLLESRCR